ncbi:MAG: hypothetical protein GX774_13870 [Armatimonadetes bacterium]|jgi:hypothetical protein|nr:hypothetical protein [Armatimonadota bacterium]
MEKDEHALGIRYLALLGDYLRREDDRALPAVRALSGEFARRQVGPEEVVAMHEQALAELLPAFPTALAAELAVRSMTFLRLAMRGFGLEPLRPYLETAVSSRFVCQIFRELETAFHLPDAARVAIGRKYADNFEGDLANRLDMFRLQGLGNLELAGVDEEHGELLFVGHDLFESQEEAEYPQDHFARGFLAQTVTTLVGRPMNCEEIACRAQGAAECRFVVTPVAPGPIANLRRLLDG